MNKKFLVLLAVVGVSLISIILANPNLFPPDNTSVSLTNVPLTNVTLTGTPADYFPEEQRSKFCGTGNAKSNNYVKEYKIPTECTLPQAITTDEFGNIWFVESNTGSVAKFDPVLESFTEYVNPNWPKSGHSMMWGIDYSPDGVIWFTDEKHNSLWKFVILVKHYSQRTFSSDDDSFLQKLQVHDSKIVINNFKGNEIMFLDFMEFEFKNPSLPISTDPEKSDKQLNSIFLPSNNPNDVTADFTIDGKNLWYTTWVPNGIGTLSKINLTELNLLIQNDDKEIPLELFSLPSDLKTPNGITVDNDGNIWLADSSSSLFFKFNPTNEDFTKYVTANPQKSTYGNYTGEIKSPASHPYWFDTDSFGKLVFNEPGSNRIGVFDPNSEFLVEYSIPSKNPHWGDCGNIQNCGLSQVFDFVINDDEIWFTEWSENNIGVVNTTIPLPIEIYLDKNEISLHPGESKNFNFSISSISENTLSSVSLILSDSSNFLDLQTNDSPLENFLPASIESINVTFYADDKLIPGKYKVLLGAETEQVSVSKFVTVIVKSQ
jgi:virginiamycin B lyase